MSWPAIAIIALTCFSAALAWRAITTVEESGPERAGLSNEELQALRGDSELTDEELYWTWREVELRHQWENEQREERQRLEELIAALYRLNIERADVEWSRESSMPTFVFDVHNRTDQTIASVGIKTYYQIPASNPSGRVTWAKGMLWHDFAEPSHGLLWEDVDGGLEPGQSATLRIEPDERSDLGRIRKHDDGWVSYDVVNLRLIDGQPIHQNLVGAWP